VAAIVVDTDALVRPGRQVQGQALITVGLPPARPGFSAFNIALVQTFTAGTAGRLHGIDFQMFRPTNLLPGTLSMSLIDGDFLAGARTVWGQQSVAIGDLRSLTGARDLEPLLRFDTARFGLALDTGDRFSVVFNVAPDGAAATAALLIGNVLGVQALPGGGFAPILERSNYAGGALVTLRSDGTPSAPGANDVGFRTVFDTGPAVIPEPASWTLLIAGFGLIGAVRRRQRAASGSPNTGEGRICSVTHFSVPRRAPYR
jgi:hypothetical protein